MKKIVLEVTDDQFDRLHVVASLVQSTPQHVMVGMTLGQLDSFGTTAQWNEWEDWIAEVAEKYGEKRIASGEPSGQRFEDTATERRVRLARESKPAAADCTGEIQVALTIDDLDAICHDIATELHSDAPFFATVDQEDYRAVLNAWREHSPRYVEEKIRRGRIQMEKGEDRVESRETLEEWRACHDAAADRLERLLPHLEAASVTA